MSRYSSYRGNLDNEILRKEYRKELAANGKVPWRSPSEMVYPNLTDHWLVRDRGSGETYYMPCHIQFGLCPFPQTITFYADTQPDDDMRVSFFHTKEVSKAAALKYGQFGDIDKCFLPFSLKNTTPYQMARLAIVLDWLCRGDFEKGRPTDVFPYKENLNIFIKTANRPDRRNLYLCVTDGQRSHEIELWDYEFFPPSGIEAVVNLITEIRNLAIKWYW